MIGRGDGTFVSGGLVSLETGATAIAVGDFNGDGVQDLVASVTRFGVSVLLGNGDGTFQAPRSLETGRGDPSSIVVGDFNGDGVQDLATSGVFVFLGNGDGTFQPPRDFPAGSSNESVAMGDFNGDGRLDLAVANSGRAAQENENPGNVAVLLGNGDGTFMVAPDLVAGSGPESVAVADFNGDGVADLAVAVAGAAGDG